MLSLLRVYCSRNVYTITEAQRAAKLQLKEDQSKDPTKKPLQKQPQKPQAKPGIYDY